MPDFTPHNFDVLAEPTSDPHRLVPVDREIRRPA